jgi:F0F1-type ATP synthase membrane subunit a
MAPVLRRVFWLVLLFVGVWCVWQLHAGTDLFGLLPFPVRAYSAVPAIAPGAVFSLILPAVVDPLSRQPVGLYNSVLTTLLVDAALVLLALFVARGLRHGKGVAGHVARWWEVVAGDLYVRYVLPLLGARARQVAPIPFAVALFMIASAAVELLPGHALIGSLAAPTLGSGPSGCYMSLPFALAVTSGECAGAAVTPILRRPTADLATAIALTLVFYFFVEIQGIRANGLHHYYRLLNFNRLRRSGAGGSRLGGIVLDVLSDLSRVVPFLLRSAVLLSIGVVITGFTSYLVLQPLSGASTILQFVFGVVQAFAFLVAMIVCTSYVVQGRGAAAEAV